MLTEKIQEIVNSFNLGFLPLWQYLFLFSQIQKYFFFQYSDLSNLINTKWVFSFSQIFGKFRLSFEYQ